MTTIQRSIKVVGERLAAAGIEEPRLEAEYLLSELLEIPRAQMLLKRSSPLSAEAIRRLDAWVKDRESRKPFAYVVGSQPFMELDLRVTPAVLVPRPETELLVDWLHTNARTSDRPLVAADIGTGSGNIAISLAKQRNIAKVLGVDLSADALTVARENARRHGVSSKIEWLQGDLLTPLAAQKIDHLVANLPYVRTQEIAQLEPELQWEPRLALDGGFDGLQIIRRCIQQAQRLLPLGAHLWLEMGYDQGELLTQELSASQAWDSIELRRDLSGHSRLLHAVRRNV